MTPERVMEIARDKGLGWAEGIGGMSEFLLAFAAQVEQETIERCAKVCEGMPYGTARGEFANAILALGAFNG